MYIASEDLIQCLHYSCRQKLSILSRYSTSTRILALFGAHGIKRKLWNVALSVPSHYLNQCRNIVNWSIMNKLQWNFNQNYNIFIQGNVFESVVCEMASILSRPQCVIGLCLGWLLIKEKLLSSNICIKYCTCDDIHRLLIRSHIMLTFNSVLDIYHAEICKNKRVPDPWK